ncbi:MAG: hypothetical protein ACYS0E_08930 [Planctomycetota bacterium]
MLCLGGAGQTGQEICRRLADLGVEAIFVHDLSRERSEAAIDAIRGDSATAFVASAGDLFLPGSLNGWEFVAADGPVSRVARETGTRSDPAGRADLLGGLAQNRLGTFTPAIVKDSLIWNLLDAYRPHVVVDSINTATVLGYAADIIQSGRDVTELSRRILDTLAGGTDEPIPVDELGRRIEALAGDDAHQVQRDLVEMLKTSLGMAAQMDTACMIRFVQCLHAAFAGDEQVVIPEFARYVKVHTTGLGGMGFNIRYTHGDTGEPGLSTKLLGKVCAAGSLTQLLLSLAHTPGCDVRVVVPAAVVGWTMPPDAIVRDRAGAGVTVVDSETLVACDGTGSIRDALDDADARVTDVGETLEVPHLASGENRPYAIEEITAVTALGQMGSITKEEVAAATLDCVAGDSRYDLLAAIDASLLLPTETAAVERDRLLEICGRKHSTGYRFPSVSIGNLGPTTAKLLYEIEIIRAAFENVAHVVEQTPARMALRGCGYILEDREGAILRRQILSLGIPLFLAKGPDRCGVLLGRRVAFPDPRDADALARPLDPDDPEVRGWIDRGWVDLTGPRMSWWHDRFSEVLDALRNDRAVSRNWFDPARPFSAGQFLGYLYSISGGHRREYR